MIVAFSRIVAPRVVLGIAPKALTASGGQAKWLMSTKVQAGPDEHSGYPIGYPTPDEVKKLAEEVKVEQAKPIQDPHFEEHWTYPFSYPTKAEVERKKDMKAEKKAKKQKEDDIRHHAWE